MRVCAEIQLCLRLFLSESVHVSVFAHIFPSISNVRASDVLAHFSHQGDAPCFFMSQNQPMYAMGQGFSVHPFFHLKPHVLCVCGGLLPPRWSCVSAESATGHQQSLFMGPVDGHNDRSLFSVHGLLEGQSNVPGTPQAELSQSLIGKTLYHE